MIYASVCDGIGAVHCAWRPLGWRCAWTSEIDKFPIAVVEHRHPGMPNLGDMTKITREMIDERGPIDVLVGGTPCQSFSVAGLRGGLDDARGNLALRFMQLCAAARPRWVVWENVPGVLSVDGGRAFGSILGALEELGYGWAYRTLDAQWFGVAQRRRRVFVVGHLGDWRRAAALLFERESVRGDPPTRESARPVAASGAGRGAAGASWWDGGQLSQTLDAVLSKGQAMPEKNRFPAVLEPFTKGKRDQSSSDAVAQAVGADCYNGAITGDVAATIGTPGSSVNASGPTLLGPACFSHSADGGSNGIAWTPDGSPPIRSSGGNCMPALLEPVAYTSDGVVADPITTAEGKTWTNEGTNFRLRNCVQQTMAVRRLTPRECERLQGFESDYTLVEHRGRPAADGPRYRAIGNSMAVPVMRWIGERIAMVDAIP